PKTNAKPQAARAAAKRASPHRFFTKTAMPVANESLTGDSATAGVFCIIRTGYAVSKKAANSADMRKGKSLTARTGRPIMVRGVRGGPVTSLSAQRERFGHGTILHNLRRDWRHPARIPVSVGPPWAWRAPRVWGRSRRRRRPRGGRRPRGRARYGPRRRAPRTWPRARRPCLVRRPADFSHCRLRRDVFRTRGLDRRPAAELRGTAILAVRPPRGRRRIVCRR